MADAASCWRASVRRDGYTVYVRPELVVEIAFNDLQESPQYPGGLALRFARVKGYRADKGARRRRHDRRGAGLARSADEARRDLGRGWKQPPARGLRDRLDAGMRDAALDRDGEELLEQIVAAADHLDAVLGAGLALEHRRAP